MNVSDHRGAPAGRIVILSGPSGVGKTSIVCRLLGKPGRARSVSATTRAAREGEVHGRNYHFLSEEEFERLVQGGWFAEHAFVHGHRYGTPRRPIEECLKSGVTCFLDIDVQGAARIRQVFPGALSIFILPPDLDALEARLRGRKTDNPEDIQRRLQNARDEMARKDEFDYRVVNDHLDRAVGEIEGILAATAVSQERQHE